MSLMGAMNRAVKLVSDRYVSTGLTTVLSETANYKTLQVPELSLSIRINYTPLQVTAYRGSEIDSELSKEFNELIS